MPLICHALFGLGHVKTRQVEWGAVLRHGVQSAQAPQPEDHWVCSGAQGERQAEQLEDVILYIRATLAV